MPLALTRCAPGYNPLPQARMKGCVEPKVQRTWMGLVSSSLREARSSTCSVNFSPPTVSTAYASRAWSGDVAKPATCTDVTVVLHQCCLVPARRAAHRLALIASRALPSQLRSGVSKVICPV